LRSKKEATVEINLGLISNSMEVWLTNLGHKKPLITKHIKTCSIMI
jgi:hypothetical protein